MQVSTKQVLSGNFASSLSLSPSFLSCPVYKTMQCPNETEKHQKLGISFNSEFLVTNSENAEPYVLCTCCVNVRYCHISFSYRNMDAWMHTGTWTFLELPFYGQLSLSKNVA